jgi:hypothetical protein
MGHSYCPFHSHIGSFAVAQYLPMKIWYGVGRDRSIGYNPTCNYLIYRPETDLATAKSRPLASSILGRTAVFLEMLSDFCHDLRIRQLVCSLNANNTFTES